MAIELVSEHLNGIKLLKTVRHCDSRGFFYESFKVSDFLSCGIDEQFVQDNHSGSVFGVVRGLHFQWDKPMGKLLRVIRGKATFIELDIRKLSKSFGKYERFELSEDSDTMLWVPAGFANGFVSLADFTEVSYKCSSYWNPKAEAAIVWNDTDLNIDWGVSSPILSPKDQKAYTFKEWQSKPESDYFA